MEELILMFLRLRPQSSYCIVLVMISLPKAAYLCFTHAL